MTFVYRHCMLKYAYNGGHSQGDIQSSFLYTDVGTIAVIIIAFGVINLSSTGIMHAISLDKTFVCAWWQSGSFLNIQRLSTESVGSAIKKQHDALTRVSVFALICTYTCGRGRAYVSVHLWAWSWWYASKCRHEHNRLKIHLWLRMCAHTHTWTSSLVCIHTQKLWLHLLLRTHMSMLTFMLNRCLIALV